MKIAIIDVETTGLEYQTDKITEVGIVIYDVDSGFPVWVYNSLNDPRMDIPDEVIALNGITNKLCKGEKVDFELLKKKAARCTYILAHNAIFDMQFILSEVGNTGGFAPGKWLCTQKLIDWKNVPGVRKSLAQSHIGADLGVFNTFPHRAVFDAATLGQIVFKFDFLPEMIKKARCKWYLFAAVKSPFHKKDLLKENGYRTYYKREEYKVLNPDTESEEKFIIKKKDEFGFWYKLVPHIGDNVINERHFLLQDIYPAVPNPKDLVESLGGIKLPFGVREYEHWYQPLMELDNSGELSALFMNEGKK